MNFAAEFLIGSFEAEEDLLCACLCLFLTLTTGFKILDLEFYCDAKISSFDEYANLG